MTDDHIGFFRKPGQRGDDLYQPAEHRNDAYFNLFLRQRDRNNRHKRGSIGQLDAACIAGVTNPQRHQRHVHHHVFQL